MKRLTLLLLPLLLLTGAPPAKAGGINAYAVVANINDDKLVLMDSYRNTYVVEAQTYCLGGGFETGDIVLSTEDLDLCLSATLISRSNGNTCDVWCP